MNLKEANTIYFIGIGGIGMSALARYFKNRGKTVYGYDRNLSPLTLELENEGMNIHYEENLNAIPADVDLVIYTPAIPEKNLELAYCKKNYIVKKRAEVLGMITDQSFTIAVGGTHGKTSITSIIAHILQYAGKSSTAFLGGISKNYNSNIIYSGNEITVVEADEYDRSFLQLQPDVAVITSMDADHLDIYGSSEALHENFLLFAQKLKADGVLLYKKGLDMTSASTRNLTYSITEVADFYATNITVEQGDFVFDCISADQEIKGIRFKVPGRHNVENAVAAVAISQTVGISNEQIKNALESYLGVKRRFEYIIRTENMVFIDDYAHHPEEIKACISAVKELYPEKKITLVFQPHLYSRTRDFAEAFAKSLGMADELILLEIYAAREEAIEGVSSAMLLDKVDLKEKELVSSADLTRHLEERDIEVLLMLGAGDIDRLIEPVKETLLAKHRENKAW